MKTINCNYHVESFNPMEAARDEYHPLKLISLGLMGGDYTFMYRYPLRNGAKFVHAITPDATAATILFLARDDYIKIYDAEDNAVGKTENIPGMLTRQIAAGPHGIWGHCLSDLYFEGIYIDELGKEITFDIGS